MYFSIIIFPDLPSFEIGTLPFPLSKTLVALYLCRKRSGFHGNVIWNTGQILVQRPIGHHVGLNNLYAKREVTIHDPRVVCLRE